MYVCLSPVSYPDTTILSRLLTNPKSIPSSFPMRVSTKWYKERILSVLREKEGLPILSLGNIPQIDNLCLCCTIILIVIIWLLDYFGLLTVFYHCSTNLLQSISTLHTSLIIWDFPFWSLAPLTNCFDSWLCTSKSIWKCIWQQFYAYPLLVLCQASYRCQVKIGVKRKVKTNSNRFASTTSVNMSWTVSGGCYCFIVKWSNDSSLTTFID